MRQCGFTRKRGRHRKSGGKPQEPAPLFPKTPHYPLLPGFHAPEKRGRTSMYAIKMKRSSHLRRHEGSSFLLDPKSEKRRQISARRRTHRAGRPCRPDKNGAARAACNHPLLRMADRSWPQRTPYRMPPPMAEIHRNRKTSRISFPTMRAKPLFDDNSRISRAPKTRLQDSQSADFGEFSPPQRLLRFRQPPSSRLEASVECAMRAKQCG